MTKVHHVGIAVPNLYEALAFYTKVMGFRVAYRFPSPDGRPSTTFVQINRDTFLEVAPAAAGVAPGLTHIGLYTDSADASVAQLRRAGATVADARPSANSGSRLANITDPFGIRIEFNEQPPESLMRKAMDAWK